MALIRPRLNDHFNLTFRQEDVDFAIPFLDEDIPLYVDPFLLWKIPSQQDNALHTAVVNSFNQIGNLFIKGKESDAKKILIELTECNECSPTPSISTGPASVFCAGTPKNAPCALVRFQGGACGLPWINYDDYFESYYIKDIDKTYDGKLKRVQILNFNRHNYDLVHTYISLKEQNTKACTNDPLFTQIPILSSKRKLKTILNLPTGKTNNADRDYEDLMVQTMSSFLYPHLDFAKEQSRTDSGTQIRDLIFYNNRSYDFLADIYDRYESRQLVIELKNVKEVEREHIN
ncbi:MAG: hypothetical protein HYZ42_11005 [Bacteroidetes bacterium]|nr:hypothetical protein [Bacteroidota bacterium]